MNKMKRKKLNKIAYLAPKGLISHGKRELCLVPTAGDGKQDTLIPLAYVAHLVLPRTFYTLYNVNIQSLPCETATGEKYFTMTGKMQF